jgi:S1-C subfamily serine protease
MNRVKSLSTILMIFATTIILSGIAPAQEMKTMIYDDDSVFMVREIGCLIKIENEKLVVNFMMDGDEPSKDQQDIDIKKGDIIAMMNGKRLKSKENFEEIFASIGEGEIVKMGIKRGQEMMIVSFDKPAAGSNQPSGMKMMVMDGPSGGEAKSTFTQDGGNVNINIEGDIEGMLPLLELGMILGEDDGVKIIQILPNFTHIFPEGKFVSNDLVSAVNGNKIATTDEFQKAFSAVSSGDDITITIQRDGKTIEETFKKPESKMKIIKGN